MNAPNSNSKLKEVKADELLRPRLLRELLGQDALKANLGTYIEAARRRKEPLDHTLFFGPPGLGKTTLAIIIANEMDSKINITSAPVLKKAGDLAAILTELMPGDVLFIDEIHRLSTSVEELLYSAMEDFRLDIVIGSGQNITTVNMDLNHFTLVGATTLSGNISKPLKTRFGIQLHLEFYPLEQLVSIVNRTARVLGLTIDDGAATAIAKRSRGTPRVANGLLRRVRDFAQVHTDGFVGEAIADIAFRQMGVDDLGLEVTDRKILELIMFQFGGGPVGVNTIATALNEDPGVVSEDYEPYMVRMGLIDRSPQGRKTTKAASDHLARWYAGQDPGGK